MAVVLGRFDAWDEKAKPTINGSSNGNGSDTPDLLIIAHNVSERTLEWRTPHDHKDALPRSVQLSKISEIQMGHSLLKVGAVSGRCLSITATGSPHITLHLQTRTDSITRDDFIKSLLTIVPRSAVFTFDAPRAGASGHDIIVKGNARDLEEMRLAGTMYREELAAKTRVENELRITKANWDSYRTASELKHQQRDTAFAAQKKYYEDVIKIAHEDLDVKKNEIRALTSRLELAKSSVSNGHGNGNGHTSVPPSPGGTQAEVNRLKELVETQRRKIQRLQEEKNKLGNVTANATHIGNGNGNDGKFGSSLVNVTSGALADFKAREDEYNNRTKQLSSRVSELESELDTSLRTCDQTGRALADAKAGLLAADIELREIRGLAAQIEDHIRPRMKSLEHDRQQWEADRILLKSLQEEKRAAWESASVAQLSARVEQLTASLSRPRESFTARSGDLTPDEIALLRRTVAVNNGNNKKGPTEEKVGAMTTAPDDTNATTTITAVAAAGITVTPSSASADGSSVEALRAQLTKAQSELVEAQGLAAKYEQLAITVENNHYLAASVADAADRVQRSEADLAALTERFHATVEDLKQKWQESKRENLVLAERYTSENKEKSACRAQLVQARAELAELQEQREAKSLQDRLQSEGATINELIEVRAKLNKSQTEAESVSRLSRELESEVARLTAEYNRHQSILSQEREKWQTKHRSDNEKLVAQEASLAAIRASLLVAEQRASDAIRRADAHSESLTICERSLRDSDSARASLTIEVARLSGEVKRLELIASGSDSIQDILKSIRADLVTAQRLADDRYTDIQNKEILIRQLEDDKRRLNGDLKAVLDMSSKAKQDHIAELANERARVATSPSTATLVDTAALDTARRDADQQRNEVIRLTQSLRDTNQLLDTSRADLIAANRRSDDALQALRTRDGEVRSNEIALQAQLRDAMDDVTRLKQSVAELEAAVKRETIRAAAAEQQLSQMNDNARTLQHVNKQLADSQSLLAISQADVNRLQAQVTRETQRGDTADGIIITLRQQLAVASAAATSTPIAITPAPTPVNVTQAPSSPIPVPVASTLAAPSGNGVSSSTSTSLSPSTPLHVRVASNMIGDVSSPLFPASPATSGLSSPAASLSGEVKKTSEPYYINVTARSLPNMSINALVTIVGKNGRGSFVDFVARTECFTNEHGEFIGKKTMTIKADIIDDFKLSIYDGAVDETKRQGSVLFTTSLLSSDINTFALSHSSPSIDASLRASLATITLTRVAAVIAP